MFNTVVSQKAPQLRRDGHRHLSSRDDVAVNCHRGSHHIVQVGRIGRRNVNLVAMGRRLATWLVSRTLTT